MLLEGGWSNWEPYYYLLQELDTVTGRIKKNGTLAEAYNYDASGKRNLWGFRDIDFDRDGDVDSNDYGHVLLWIEFSGDGNPTSNPGTDGDMDGGERSERERAIMGKADREARVRPRPNQEERRGAYRLNVATKTGPAALASGRRGEHNPPQSGP